MTTPQGKPANSTLRKLFGFFLQGLLILAPIGITMYVLYWLFDQIDGILRPYVGFTGLGFLIIIVFVLLIGWISSNFLLGSIINFFDRWLERTPGIKLVYSFIKDFFEAFAGDKRKFNKPVLANLFGPDVWIVGFMTDEELQKFELGAEMVGVYVPQAYNFAGQLYILPRNKVKMVEHLSSGEVMKYAVTGGVAEVEEKEDVQNVSEVQ